MKLRDLMNQIGKIFNKMELLMTVIKLRMSMIQIKKLTAMRKQIKMTKLMMMAFN